MSNMIKTITKQIKVPQGVYFGCFGNPMPLICSCCNTDKKNLENYVVYLNRKKNWKQLNYKKETYKYKKGLFIFTQKNE